MSDDGIVRVYLRWTNYGTPNECWTLCAKGDPGAVEFNPADSIVCAVCGGDCAAANPPVMNCPLTA